MIPFENVAFLMQPFLHREKGPCPFFSNASHDKGVRPIFLLIGCVCTMVVLAGSASAQQVAPGIDNVISEKQQRVGESHRARHEWNRVVDG